MSGARFTRRPPDLEEVHQKALKQFETAFDETAVNFLNHGGDLEEAEVKIHLEITSTHRKEV